MAVILSALGLFYILKISFKWLLSIIYGFKTYILPKYVRNDEWIRSLGSWAVVTGCTHGIGLAYAKELAKRKLNLILISRNGESLEKVAKVLGLRLSSSKYRIHNYPYIYSWKSYFLNV
jgi:17beta-estradiol 17-dehydrogenase / very-long-chain 3-oxoacyl-CoA reductase